jgi:hypothetical protein
MGKLRAYAVAGSTISFLVLLSTVANSQSTVPLAGPPIVPSTGPVASSSAYGIDGTFTSENQTIEVGPIGAVAGKAPRPYNKTVRVAKINKSAAIVEGSLPIPTFFLDASGIKSHAASQGIAIDSVSAEGDAAIKSLNLMISLNPPPPGASPLPLPFLALSGTAIASSANFSRVFPGTPVVTGSAEFGSLSIIGSLIGYQTLTYAGSAPKNTVIYQSPTVTITLNKEVVAGVISCQLRCAFTPSGITTRAVDISLNNADIRGSAVTGDIAIAESAAQ